MYPRKICLNLGEETPLQHKTLSCKVCRDAGKGIVSVGHGPKSQLDEGIVKVVKEQGWNLIREIVCTTNCPTLMNTLCPNPNCFNGADGIIRFPNLGHSMSYCPCEWPEKMSGEKEHERYTTYINQCLPCIIPPPPPLPLLLNPEHTEVIPPAPDVLLLDQEFELYDEDINEIKARDEKVCAEEFIYDEYFLNNFVNMSGKDVDEELDEIFNYEFNLEEWNKQLKEDQENEIIDPEEELDEIINHEFNLEEWNKQLKEDEVERNMPQPTLEEQQENWDNLYGWYHNENEHNYLQRLGHHFRKIPVRCRHFGKHGCRMNETCKFLHIPERPESPEIQETFENNDVESKLFKSSNIYLALS